MAIIIKAKQAVVDRGATARSAERVSEASTGTAPEQPVQQISAVQVVQAVQESAPSNGGIKDNSSVPLAKPAIRVAIPKTTPPPPPVPITKPTLQTTPPPVQPRQERNAKQDTAISLALDELADALLNASPGIESHIVTIHTALRNDPAQVVIMTDEERGIFFRGLMRVTGQQITVSAKANTSKNKTHSLSLDDL